MRGAISIYRDATWHTGLEKWARSAVRYRTYRKEQDSGSDLQETHATCQRECRRALGPDPERSVSERFGHIHLLPAMGSQGSAVAKVAGVEDIKIGIVGTGLSEFDAKHCIRSI